MDTEILKKQSTPFSLDKSSPRYAGFIDLIELVGDAGEDGRVSDYYREHTRRCIVGFKRPMMDVLADNGVI